MRSDEQELVRLRSQLRSALRNKELVLYFQPKIDLTNGCVAGAEALVRWEHPERGLLDPAAFIHTTCRAYRPDRTYWRLGNRRSVPQPGIVA
ncbi:EAL domain-containing protein [Paraburkholderia hospita]|uniref:EAL domain-containing protein n=1 Tax=Paraburkholderia hospita TaxID=169430 RepID=UPI0009D95E79|nr:hypothetical protein CA602_23810 [Paraburkholderia hospita]